MTAAEPKQRNPLVTLAALALMLAVFARCGVVAARAILTEGQ